MLGRFPDLIGHIFKNQTRGLKCTCIVISVLALSIILIFSEVCGEFDTTACVEIKIHFVKTKNFLFLFQI